MMKFLRVLFLVFLSQASDSLQASNDFIENSLHEDKLKTILEKEFSSSDYKLIEKIEKGFSSPGIYKIQVSDKTLIFRVPSIYRPITACENEILVMKKASEFELAPKIYGSHEGTILMDFIFSEELESDFIKKSDLHIQNLGEKLAKLHKLPITLEKEILSVFDIPHLLLKIMVIKPSLCEEALKEFVKLVEENKNNFASHLIHADSNLNNILYTKDTGFIFLDYEISGLGDGNFDLATLSNYLSFDTEHDEKFLTAYYGESPSNERKQKFELFKKIHMLYAGIGCFYASQKMDKNNILLSETEINEIPSLKEYQKILGNLFKVDPKDYPKYGYAFLKEALKK